MDLPKNVDLKQSDKKRGRKKHFGRRGKERSLRLRFRKENVCNFGSEFDRQG